MAAKVPFVADLMRAETFSQQLEQAPARRHTLVQIRAVCVIVTDRQRIINFKFDSSGMNGDDYIQVGQN